MPVKIEPRLGLQYGWDFGESGWNTGVDANFIKLGTLYGLYVKSMSVTDPATITPNAGDVYIPGVSSVGDWAGLDGNVVVYIDGVWSAYTPEAGWVCRVQDEGDALYLYNGTLWSAEIHLADGGAISTGTGTGANIGKTVSDKIGFWGAPPVVQPSGTNQTAYTPTNADGDIASLTFSATPTQLEVEALRDACEIVADDMRGNNTLLTAIRDALVQAGIIKGSA